VADQSGSPKPAGQPPDQHHTWRLQTPIMPSPFGKTFHASCSDATLTSGGTSYPMLARHPPSVSARTANLCTTSLARRARTRPCRAPAHLIPRQVDRMAPAAQHRAAEVLNPLAQVLLEAMVLKRLRVLVPLSLPRRKAVMERPALVRELQEPHSQLRLLVCPARL